MRSSTVSAAIVGALIGFVAIMMTLRPRPNNDAVPVARRPAATAVASPPPGGSTAPLSPDQARSSALFERNRSMPADPDLASEYEDLNAEYFANILPAPQV